MYAVRLAREQAVTGHRPWHKPLLSVNVKTGLSLNLPVMHCQPSRRCARVCYACQGTTVWPDALAKAVHVDRLINEDPERAAAQIASELGGRVLRLFGTGDGAPHHLPLLRALRARSVALQGFTRRPSFWSAARAIGYNLMFSLDISMRGTRRWAFVMRHVPQPARAYLRSPGDPDLSDVVGVTFPEHGSRTPNVDKVPVSRTDCPAIRHHTKCEDCKRCFLT